MKKNGSEKKLTKKIRQFSVHFPPSLNMKYYYIKKIFSEIPQTSSALESRAGFSKS